MEMNGSKQHPIVPFTLPTRFKDLVLTLVIYHTTLVRVVVQLHLKTSSKHKELIDREKTTSQIPFCKSKTKIEGYSTDFFRRTPQKINTSEVIDSLTVYDMLSAPKLGKE